MNAAPGPDTPWKTATNTIISSPATIGTRGAPARKGTISAECSCIGDMASRHTPVRSKLVTWPDKISYAKLQSIIYSYLACLYYRRFSSTSLFLSRLMPII